MSGLEVKETGTTRVKEVSSSLEDYDGSTSIVVIEIEYAKIGGITPACALFIAALFLHFGPLPIGTVAVRFIKGTHTWSQHAYGNAVDVMVSGDLHRRVAFWADANRSALSIAHLLADPYFPSPLGDHGTHVHCDFYPQWGGTPPGHPI